MAGNKFVLLIVEGTSDEAILGEYCYALNRQLIHKKIRFKVTGGDVLTDTRRKRSGEEIVQSIFNQYLRKTSLKATDFIHIFQVCDIDGSYFPVDKILADTGFPANCKPSYLYSPGNNSIYVSSKKRGELIKTWEIKRKRQEELISLDKVKGVPFSIYYNSFFLEHVLSGRVDIPEEDKEGIIDAFISNHALAEYDDFFKKKMLAEADEYMESWNNLSLSDFSKFESCSNVFLLLKRLRELAG